MPLPQLSGIKAKNLDSSSESAKVKYIDADKKVDIKSYLDRLQKEEKRIYNQFSCNLKFF